mmetsp:Transcript_20393/g.43487  ORF Transcript_20393/g.43487 Transcript_20393/m.43487 type:complete len:95 (+) Transcript_20393:170-454(+)
MWLRCIFSWAFAAIVYAAVRRSVGEENGVTASCPAESELGYTLCPVLADARLLVSFVLGAGLCWRCLRGWHMEPESADWRWCSPEKAQLCRLSL